MTMKKFAFALLLLLTFQLGFSQKMNNEKLGTILESVADSIQGNNGQWQFKIKDVFFMCVTDANHNRMRIISPITEAQQLDEKLKSAALVANFHSALDVKYAIADDILWSAFIHPLKELTEGQVRDAVKQVYTANITFGTTFSSTDLVFPGGSRNKENPSDGRARKKKRTLIKEN